VENIVEYKSYGICGYHNVADEDRSSVKYDAVSIVSDVSEELTDLICKVSAVV
jgi:hypothetical protein